MSVAISAPSVQHTLAFRDMVADFEMHAAENAEFYVTAKDDFGSYVRGLLDEERGLKLSSSRVPCTHRWLIDGAGAVVGATRLRHSIDTPLLRDEVGHFGDDVAPSHRGRGYGHAALRAALDEARAPGIDRVLLLADESNEPSRRTILRQGGELEVVKYSEHWRQRVCRYWIRLQRNDG